MNNLRMSMLYVMEREMRKLQEMNASYEDSVTETGISFDTGEVMKTGRMCWSGQVQWAHEFRDSQVSH